MLSFPFPLRMKPTAAPSDAKTAGKRPAKPVTPANHGPITRPQTASHPPSRTRSPRTG